MERINILIIDDHPMFRNACSNFLGLDDKLHVLACTGDVNEALEIIREKAVQVILLDINMPVDGFDLARQIKLINKDAKIIGFSLHPEASVAEKLQQCGASGFVSKSASIEEISDAIIWVYSGESYFGH